MALSIKQDEQQWQQLIDAINDLSTNIGKGQALIREAIEAGFTSLSGSPSETQQQALINQLATNLGLSTDDVEAAIKQAQPEERIT